MTFCNFTTTTHGKWILTGEHAVIRGHAAIAFPIKNKKLILTYQASSKDLSADYSGSSGTDLHLLFWSLLEHGMQLLDKSLNRLQGHFHIECDIPLGVGMGASAALCVATARWFAAQNLIDKTQTYEFARSLEDLFHGESSGLDIAGVNATHGIYFQQHSYQQLNIAWQPHWYLSSCEQMGITSHCIQQVKTMWQQKPLAASAIDSEMKQSVTDAKDALLQPGTNSLSLLAKAINQARVCFQKWGLISDSLHNHMQNLLENGAIAVKPTGSGGGGNVISLWESIPDDTSKMIAL